MKLKNILTLGLCLLAVTVFGQKMKLTSGTFKALEGQKEVAVTYIYDDMDVGTGKRAMKEPDYVVKKTNEYNEKESGRGDNWAKSWEGDRTSRFQGKFETLFNKVMSKAGMSIKEGAESKYTLVVHTTMTEPGFSIPMMMTVPAGINLKISLVETGNDEALGEMSLIGAPGNAFAGAAWDTGSRIQEAYAKAGKSFAKWLPKKGMK